MHYIHGGEYCKDYRIGLLNMVVIFPFARVVHGLFIVRM